jgi:HD-GYP domain-containing protein (c-di-GMP phosphodiesterase class II)
MIRFSDIIKIQDRSRSPAPCKPEGIIEREDAFISGKSLLLRTIAERHATSDSWPKDKPGINPACYYEKFIVRAMEVQKRVRAGQGISPSPIISDLHYIIDSGLVDRLFDYAMSAGEDCEDLIVHIVDVTFASLKIGQGMNYDIKTLLKLGLAAFLENVGFHKIPDRITRDSKNKDSELVRKHPEISRQILTGLGEKYKWLADTALQVHERSDGSGYPNGLKSGDILEFASIIGLVDSFVASIKNKPYKEKSATTEAAGSIVTAGNSLFPPGIVDLFLQQCLGVD